MARRLALIALAALFCAPAFGAGPAEKVVSPGDRTGLSLTLYQDDNALVRDRRAVSLDRGTTTLVWEGVARGARTATGILSGSNLTVRTQGFDVEGATGERLLAGAVGKDVTVLWRDADGGERAEQARVLAARGTPLFDVGGKVVAGQPDRIVYDSLPAGLRTMPTFTGQVSSEAAGRRDVELSYMTGGLSWQADYVGELAPAGDRLVLSAWTTLTNDSGMDFPNARVAVVAGRPNRTLAMEPRRGMPAAAAPGAPPPPDHDAVGPYHEFVLPEPVSLLNGERTQAVLIPPGAVKVQRELVFEPLPSYAWRGRFGEAKQNPVAILKLDNALASGLGKPLPAGVLRIYQRGRDGALTFLGEDRLAATPVHGIARIAVGQAFDVAARRSQTDFQHVSADVSESAFEVRLTNAGDKAVPVTVRETFGSDWLVLEESQPHHRDDAFGASWTTTIPAKGETTLKYRVRVKG
ncbi:MAG: DUF4139 domain-containing protein [Magnetospirillum sp.]|nr:DUF4139 domain-containing protein [Magnetospirillum sp.]